MDEETSVSVELVAKMEEEACRLARETAAGDACVVAGRAGVAENSALVGRLRHRERS